MLSSALSMPAPTGNIHRDKSQQNNTVRSKSQPVAEDRYNLLSPPSPPSTHPLKNFFGNLLHLTPHRHISTLNTFANRSKISSSFSTAISSERSSRLKPAHQSVVSTFSIRSTDGHLLYVNRVYLLVIFFYFSSVF